MDGMRSIGRLHVKIIIQFSKTCCFSMAYLNAGLTILRDQQELHSLLVKLHDFHQFIHMVCDISSAEQTKTPSMENFEPQLVDKVICEIHALVSFAPV